MKREKLLKGILVICFSISYLLSQPIMITGEHSNAGGESSSHNYSCISILGQSMPGSVEFHSTNYKHIPGFIAAVGKVSSSRMDNICPVINHTPFTAHPLINTVITITATAVDDQSGLSQLLLLYRKTGDHSKLDSINFDINNEAAIPPDINTQRGVEYAIAAFDQAGNVSHLPAESRYYSIEVDLGQTLAFQSTDNPLPAGTRYTDFRIFSIPFELDDQKPSTLFENVDNLDTYDGKSWQLFDIIDNNLLSYQEIKDLPLIKPGKGFLLTANIADKYISVRNAHSPNVNKYSKIALNEGWNLIGNPFDFDIPYQNILLLPAGKTDISNLYTPIAWTLTETGWQLNPLLLERWNGWAIEASEGDTLIIKAETGVSEAQRQYECRFIDDDWGINIIAQGRDNEDQCNYIGVCQTEELIDQIIEPFKLGNEVSLYIEKGLESESKKKLSTEIKLVNEEGYYWDLVIEGGNAGDEITLFFQRYGNIPENFSKYIIDHDLKLAYDMTILQDWQLNLKMNKMGKRNLRILIGSKEYIEQNSDGISLVPEEFTLRQNFPNPFNPSTYLVFTLPKETKVTLKVFNILGQKICTLINNVDYQAGYHLIEWDSRNNWNQNVASGMYIFCLIVDGKIKIRKGILIR